MTPVNSDAHTPRHRFFVVHNRNAGRRTRTLYESVLSRLRDAGASVEVAETARHGEGMAAARDAAIGGAFDAVVAAGGDGTVHDVAMGVLGHPVPLGILPIGTANVFSREIGLPKTAEALAGTLLRSPAEEFPVGSVNGWPFLFVVGVGFDAEAVRQFEATSTRSFGRAGFAGPVLRALFSNKASPLRVRTDSRTIEAQWIIVTRSPRYAASMMLAPDADLRGALLHVLCMNGAGSLMRVAQLSALATGRLRSGPGVTCDTTRRVWIEGAPGVPVQVDGEMQGTLPLEIGTHSRKLAVIVPQMARSFGRRNN